jgi:glutathione S-transferase
MFLAEKDVQIPTEEIDIMSGANRQSEFLRLNPGGQSPALVLDSGKVISEITAICEYLEELHPQPPLIGRSAEERAETRMWTRRIDLNIVEPLTNGFRYAEGLPMFKDRIYCIPHAAADLKEVARRGLLWLDGLLGNAPFIAGERFTLADILLFCFVDFGARVGQPLDRGNRNILRWHESIAARPSASASVHASERG